MKNAIRSIPGKPEIKSLVFHGKADSDINKRSLNGRPSLYTIESTGAEKSSKAISLQKLISRLIRRFQKKAVLQQSFIVNDVPAHLYVDMDRHTLAAVIIRLFKLLISQTRMNCIRVSASRYNNMVLVCISNTSGTTGTITDNCLFEIRAMADWLGGSITVDDLKQKPSSIILRFRCLANAT